jgi:hypothetical protein
MAGENIFALQLSAQQPQEVLPASYGGVAWDSGYRSVLAVTMIWAKVQTTVLFGNSLYLIWNNTSSLDPQQAFTGFVKRYGGRPIHAVQLPYPPFAATPAYYMRSTNTPNIQPPPVPTSAGFVTMLDAGFDPLRGYWIEFAGNYYLQFPLFKDWPTVIRDGPATKGFQPSANNPGSGGSGSGSGGSGSGTPPQNC